MQAYKRNILFFTKSMIQNIKKNPLLIKVYRSLKSFKKGLLGKSSEVLQELNPRSYEFRYQCKKFHASIIYNTF